MATQLPDAAAATGGSETQAQFKTFVQNVRAALAEMGDPLGKFGVIQNLSLSLSVAANALTIAVKNRGGADPDGTAGSELPVSVPFRNSTASTGDFSVLNVTAASSLVISSGSTLGTVANVPFRLWIVAFNDGGTWRIGVINCLAGSAAAGYTIFPLGAWPIASSTAEGGAGAADSAQTFYTGVAVTSKPYVVLGYATWEAGLATPGTWSAGPTRVQLFGAGVPLPGARVQRQRTVSGASATGTTIIPLDNTTPQNTEGDQYFAQAITPTSAANLLSVSWEALFSNSGNGHVICAIFQDAVASALATSLMQFTSSDQPVTHRGSYDAVAGLTSSTTFKLRAGANSAGTTRLNNQNTGGAVLNGTLQSNLTVEEVMA